MHFYKRPGIRSSRVLADFSPVKATNVSTVYLKIMFLNFNFLIRLNKQLRNIFNKIVLLNEDESIIMERYTEKLFFSRHVFILFKIDYYFAYRNLFLPPMEGMPPNILESKIDPHQSKTREELHLQSILPIR